MVSVIIVGGKLLAGKRARAAFPGLPAQLLTQTQE